jgi:hypothetical protein
MHQPLVDQRQGSGYANLVQVEGYLAVERARGAQSPIAPWIDALPST